MNQYQHPNTTKQYTTSAVRPCVVGQDGSIDFGAAAPSQPPNGLMLDAGAIMARLSDISDRVCRLNDRLNGLRPAPGETEAIKPHEPDTLRRLTDRSIDLINVIELELNFIEAKL